MGCSAERDDELSRYTALRGVVTSTDATPLSGATVTSAGATVTTDASGRYELRIAAGERVRVHYDAPGHIAHLGTVDVFDGRFTQRDTVLRPEAAPVPLDADAGGTVDGSRGASVSVPPGALVDSSGRVATGMVDVHLTPIDPSSSAELAAVSGDMTGRRTDGEETLIESFGMLEITIRAGGETLQVASGSELEIRIPMPAETAAAMPESVPLWSMDEETGLWVEEGIAIFEPAVGAFVARIPHMSTWNADRPASATCICGTVVDEDDAPVPGATLVAEGVDYLGTTSATADEDGKFCIVVRRSSRVLIHGYHLSGGGEEREVTSGEGGTSIPARIGDPRCSAEGRWTVAEDVVRVVEPPSTTGGGPGGGSGGCGSWPFAGTCADGLLDVVRCFDPRGGCSYVEATGARFTISWDSGARIVTTIDAGGGRGRSELISSTGERCATVGFETATSQVDYTLADGSTFRFLDGLLICPDGTAYDVERLTAATRECGLTPPPTAGTMMTSCAPPSGAPPPGTSGTCTYVADCSAMDGEVCCDLGSIAACVPAADCAAAMGTPR